MNYRTNNNKITEEESKIIRKLFLNGMTGVDIAAKFKKPVNTIYRYTVSVEQRESYAAKDKAAKKNLPEDQKNARKLRNIAYLNTESGFMLSKYHDVKRSSQKKQARPINAGKKIELLSQEEFFELWTQHKAKQGITCGYTGYLIIKMHEERNKHGVI